MNNNEQPDMKYMCFKRSLSKKKLSKLTVLKNLEGAKPSSWGKEGEVKAFQSSHLTITEWSWGWTVLEGQTCILVEEAVYCFQTM